MSSSDDTALEKEVQVSSLCFNIQKIAKELCKFLFGTTFDLVSE